MCNQSEGAGVCVKWSTLRLLAFSIFAALLAIPLGLHAQQYSGTIVGTVSDSSGGAVPGASVTVINTGSAARLTQKSGSQGEFTFAQLPVGTYEVHVTAANFKEFIEQNVEVHTSTNTQVPAVLQVGAVSQKVTVQADQVQVQTTSASVGEVISGTQVRELPLNGENFVGLTQLSPGVSAAQGANFEGKGLGGGVNFSVNGNPYNYNLFLVDGVNNNDVGSGRTILVYPSVDTIAEFKMIRNSYGPEYGQAAGAIISITTRSGENQIHGGFFYAGRNDLLDANDWFSNHSSLGKAEERRNDYGYNISGPVLKDRLFLWFNQEWNKEINGVGYGTCVPTVAESGGNFAGYSGTTDQCGATIPTIPAAYAAAGNPNQVANPDAGGLLIAQFYPYPNVNPSNGTVLNGAGQNWVESLHNNTQWSEWNVRGDYNLTKSERATMRWTQDSWNNPYLNDPSVFWGDSFFPTVNSSWSQPSKSVMGKLSSTLSSTLVNDLEFGYGNNAIITALEGTRADIVSGLETAYPAQFPTSIKTPGEFFGGWGGLNPYGSYNGDASIWNIAPYANHEDLYTLQDNLTKVKGDHLLKAGFFYSTNVKVENSGAGADRPTLPGSVFQGPGAASVQTNNNLANILIPGTGALPQEFNVSENSIDQNAKVHWNDYEFYLGDTWKIRRNVTVDYGFRWSIYREPVDVDNHWANWSASAWSASEATANPTDACNGILTVPGTSPCAAQKAFLASIGVDLPLSNGTPGPNRALVQQNLHAIAPRVGIAWDVKGDGTLAIRAGGGQFNQREVVGLAENLSKNAPFVIGLSDARPIDTAPPIAGASVSPNATKTTGGFIPNSWQWNLTVEQQVARNTTLELGYVGNIGEHLTSQYDSNSIPQTNWLNAAFAPDAATENSYRRAFNFGSIGGFARGGHASYNSLQALFRTQTGNFSTFQAAYTWGHSLGNVDLDNSSGGVGAEATTDQSDPGIDKGNTNINRPNIFVANEVFFLPKLASHGMIVRNVVGGWEANSIVSLAQGSSLTVYSNGASGACTNLDASGNCIAGYNSTLNSLAGTGYNANQRPLSTDVSCNQNRSGDQILSPAHFTLIGYTLGTFPTNLAHRGACYGSPNTNVDSQLAKNWYIKEKYRLKFSMDFFNLFNHPNFNSGNLEGAGFTSSNPVYCGGATAPVKGAGPSGQPCSATNNVITSTGQPTAASPNGFGAASAVSRGREMQYTLRFTF
jgi:hypothetical protein